MNLYPYSNGHLLVIPNEIVDKPEDLGEEILLDIMKISSLSMMIIRLYILLGYITRLVVQ